MDGDQERERLADERAVTPLNYREFQKLVCNMLADARAILEPDDDWQPVVFGLDHNKRLVIAALMIDKEHWVDAIRELIAAEHLRIVALCTTAWLVLLKEERAQQEWRAAGHPTPSEHPAREEVLTFTLYDAERVEMWYSKLTRSDDAPPEMDEWTQFTEGKDRVISGRFDPIREALR